MTTATLPQQLINVNPIKIQSWFSNGFISENSNESDLNVFLDQHYAVQAKPFVKWVGGKRQLLKQFHDLYPKEFNPTTNTYFEPFVGGGAVFFDLQPYSAVLTDVNFELITTYKVIRDDVENLIIALKKHKYEKEYFLKMRAKDPKKSAPLKIASRFIYLNRTCFNGMYRVNKGGGFNVPFGAYKNPTICDEKNLRHVSNLLENTKVELRNYDKVLNHAKKGDFVYFDPPYDPINKTSSFTSYTAGDFVKKDQKKLRDLFFELNKRECFVMLSNSNTELINNIYSDLADNIKINLVQAGRSINANASKRGKISEVVITNY